jgi:hypothetical protein
MLCAGNVCGQRSSWNRYADGDWTPSATHDTIFTPQQLAQLAALVNGGDNFDGRLFTLANNLDLGAHEWIPIGQNAGTVFQGSFDGAHNTVRGLRINRDGVRYSGLFGYVDDHASIKNLSVAVAEGDSIRGGNCTGILVGWAEGAIMDCHVTGKVVGDSYVGGLAGCVANVNAVGGNSSADCEVIARQINYACAGGLVGSLGAGTLRDCRATGTVGAPHGVGHRIGGLVGRQGGGSAISASCAAVVLNGTGCPGGLVGYQWGSVADSYFDKEVSGVTYGVGDKSGSPSNTGTIPLTSVEIKEKKGCSQR